MLYGSLNLVVSKYHKIFGDNKDICVMWVLNLVLRKYYKIFGDNKDNGIMWVLKFGLTRSLSSQPAVVQGGTSPCKQT